MKKTIVPIFISCLLVIVFAFFGIQKANASISAKVDQNMAGIVEYINQLAVTDPKAAMSSNPYTYIANNPNYKNIVNLGYDALPVLTENMEKSNNNGLTEYILAIAVEEIAKVDLKKNRNEWSTAKEFLQVWKLHLKNLPSNVNSVINSNQPEDLKVKELVLLGTPAIPFIMDKIEQGNTEIFPALEQLLSGNPNSIQQPVQDKVAWVRLNKAKFKSLQGLVNKESQ